MSAIVIYSVADPDSGSAAFLTLGSGMGKKSESGSRIRTGMNNPDHISDRLETFFGLKILEFFDADPGSGMENIWIRDPVSGINIPDPQHWSYLAGSSITLILSDSVTFKRAPPSFKSFPVS